MMNETGSYPGQVWLWLYTFWYQIKPFSTSDNADVLVMGVMGVLSLAFVLVPFLPGVRSLPRRIPIYKLIWREHYRAQNTAAAATVGIPIEPSGSPPT
jgi:quinol-cytochrome oxidoreductase complex cytochrome b subunit